MDEWEGDHMKGPKRHRPEQILRRLAEGDEMLNKGATVAEVARAFAHHRDHLVPLEADLRPHEGARGQAREGALSREPAREEAGSGAGARH